MNPQEAALVRAAKIMSVVLSGLLLVIGIILVGWSAELTPTLRFLFGIAAMLVGGVRIFGYFTNDLYRIAFQFDLATGTLVVIFGILLLAFPTIVLPHLATCVILYVMLDGLFKLQTAVDAHRFGMPYWYLLLLGALLLVLGALLIGLFGGAESRMVLMGVVLIAHAVINTFVTMYTVRVRVRKRELPRRRDHQK